MAAKYGLLSFKCVDCNKTSEENFDEDLSKRFEKAFQFCDAKQKFVILSHAAESCLSIWVHGWLGKIKWNVITHKEIILQQSANTETHKCWLQILDTIWEDFGLQNPVQYHGLFDKSNILFLAGIFENFRNK